MRRARGRTRRLVLALPLAPLCRPDCPGPAPELYPTTPGAGEGELGRTGGAVGDEAGGADDAGEPRGDPRWAALRDLHFD
ncbi:MAG: hypothetical protein GEV08_03470 [Acidimicrobiia bacterium]|nr:hypothetical protein [Acidimicrobiia bacterium]